MSKVSIDDLVSSSETGTGVATPNEEIELGIPQQKEITNPNQKKIANGSGKNRVVADLSSVPKKEVETAGITVKESLQKDILGPGGEFEQYINEKAAAMAELNESIDRHNEAVAAAMGEEVPEEITEADVERSKKANLDLENQEGEVYEDELASAHDEYVDEMELEEEEEDENIVEFKQPSVKKTTPKEETEVLSPETIDPKSIKFDIDEEDTVDLDTDSVDEDIEDDEESAEELDNDEIYNSLRADITAKMSPVSKNFDISGFTKVKKAVRATNVVESLDNRTAEWALMSAGTKIAMSPFSGTDIEDITNTDGLSRIGIVTKRYKILYDHLCSDKKPATLEAWVRSLSFLDNDNVFMNAYIATFSGANYIPRDCGKCKNTFLTDNIPMDQMYSLDSPVAEKRFHDIMSGEFGEVSDLYVTEAIPVSDKIAIYFREPSVYSILFEPSYLDEQFATKYQAIISAISYIDDICYIDKENGTLNPIYYKKYPTNKVKDIKSRIIEFSKIIKSLSPDEYNIVAAYINAINNRKNTKITYKIPETRCPKCGNLIPEQTITAQDMVFTRHQLAALATTSIS